MQSGSLILCASIAIALAAISEYYVNRDQNGIGAVAFVAALCFAIITVELAIGPGYVQ